SVGVAIAAVARGRRSWARPADRAMAAAKLGGDLEHAAPAHREPTRSRSPGEWLEHSPILTVLVVALGAVYLVRYFRQSHQALNAVNLNVVNLAFLLAGFALHGTP